MINDGVVFDVKRLVYLALLGRSNTHTHTLVLITLVVVDAS